MKTRYLIDMKTRYLILIFFTVTASCKNTIVKQSQVTTSWNNRLKSELPLLGHRNWILVVDKAFPLQTSSGLEVINTDERLENVLKIVLEDINATSHIKPIIFMDKELDFITEDQVKGIHDYRAKMMRLLNNQCPNKILHDSVFVKIDAASKLFKIVVLKTNQTIPYSSVFFQLDCAYWSPAKEKKLRENMMFTVYGKQ